jgi:hypothetical protein
MSQFENYKFRASSIAKLMVNPKKANEVLSETTKTFLNELYEDTIFGESPEVNTIEMQKGNIVENDAIALLRKVRQKFYQKHPELEELSNDYITGHPDIIDIGEEKIIDIKCPFRVRTWFRYTENDAIKNYYWQLLSYMWLTNYKKAEIAVCAVETPEHLIFEDLKTLGSYYKEQLLSPEEYQDWERKAYNLHNFNAINENDRIKFYNVKYNETDIDRLISRIKAAREYLIQLESSESLSLAIQKTATESFLSLTSSTNSNLSMTDQIISKYREFGIELKFDEKIVGASVSQYRFTPLKKGVKIEKAQRYNADIQALLKSDSVLIETPIPKTGQIGIQIPNEVRTTISMPEANAEKNLVLSIGQSIDGQDYKLDLATAPHLLIAGATGSGKSVLLKTIISQLESKNQDFIILDPKREFEFSVKDHTDIFNELKIAKQLIQERTKTQDKSKFNPHVIILDEMETLLADNRKIDYEIDLEKYPPYLTLEGISAKGKFTSKQVKNPAYEEQLKIQKNQPKLGEICRELIEYIVRLGRSEKVHLICATQNPTVKNISSSIKANCPTRISLRVASTINSQVILDNAGGEKLLGNGDMLLMSPFESNLIRLQGYYI